MFIQKIYPDISELTTVCNNIVCPEIGCNKTFTSQSNVTMHLRCHHKRQRLESSDDNTVKQFHCPNTDCVYNRKQYFMKIKYLKQHYLKMHANRMHLCYKCGERFSTEWFLNDHLMQCGVKFTCPCGNGYKSYEALLTHGRRKKHEIPPKTTFINNNKPNPEVEQQFEPQPQIIQLIPIIIQQVQPEQKCVSVQTEFAYCQTNTTTKQKRSVEIQTDESELKSMNSSPKKQTETFSDTSQHMKKNAISFLNNNQLNLFDNCNIETQTDDIIFQDEFLQTKTNDDQELDLYTNMCTQTYDDLFTDSVLTNIQTQTHWTDYEDDTFVSTETQTLLTQNIWNRKGISHMETQTDLEFKQLLLEEINA